MEGESVKLVSLRSPTSLHPQMKPIECVMRAVLADNRDISMSFQLEGADTSLHNALLDHMRVLINRQGALSDLPVIEAEIDKHLKAMADQRRDLDKANADQDKKIHDLRNKLQISLAEQESVYDSLRRDFEHRRRPTDTRDFDPNAPRVKSAIEAPSKKCAELQIEIEKLEQERKAANEGVQNNLDLFQAALDKLLVRRQKALDLIGD